MLDMSAFSSYVPFSGYEVVFKLADNYILYLIETIKAR